MQYAIIAHDGKGMLEKRLVVRQRHLENIARIKGKVICAGGFWMKRVKWPDPS